MKIEKNLNEEIKVNDTLNPKLWNDNDELRDDVKERLLDIADNFLDDLKEDGLTLNVVDIRLLGSSANYNYTDMSDIDLHIVADLGTTDDINIMQLLCNAYKSLFNSKYNIKVKGREVELYVEDVNQPAKSNGVYSLYTGWVKKPVRTEIPEIDYDELEKQFDEWEDRYFDIVGEHTSELEETLSQEVDSEGNLLTPEQVEFFKDSKIRDSQGRLLVVYHGTDAEFDTFKKGDIGFHFGTETQARDIVANKSKKNIGKYYLNITSPLIIDKDLGVWDAYSISAFICSNNFYNGKFKNYLPKFLKSLNGLDDVINEITDFKYDDLNDVSYTLEDAIRSIVDYFNLDDQLDYADWENQLVRDVLVQEGYDGINYKNVFEDFGSGDRSYIAFNPNQIKSIDNKQPSSSTNINEEILYHGQWDDDLINFEDRLTWFTPHKEYAQEYGGKIFDRDIDLSKYNLLNVGEINQEIKEDGEYTDEFIEFCNAIEMTPEQLSDYLKRFGFHLDYETYICGITAEYPFYRLLKDLGYDGVEAEEGGYSAYGLIDFDKDNKNPNNSNNINENKLLEIYPKDNETKRDFISRFMSANEKEYPNQKQRLAVAYSYWDKRDRHNETLESKCGKESLKEMVKFEEDAFDIYVFESPYQVKDFLSSKTEPQRLYIENDLYLVANAYDCTHTDMKNVAYQNGYLSTDVVNDFDKNQVCAIYCPDSYHTNEFEIYDVVGDDYDFKYKTNDGYIYSRYQDIKNFKLFNVLGGNPKRLEFVENFRTKLKESDDFDYGTGDVNGSDIFDTSTTGTTGSWRDLLLGNDVDYYKNKKNLVGDIVQMSPQEYYDACANMFSSKKHKKVTADELKQQREYDKEILDYLKTVITDKKKKFPIAVLDLSYYPGQEGLHRMMVAGDLFGWDTKFPVLVIRTYDQEKQKRIERNYAQNKFNDNVEKAINYLDGWEFYDYDEFYDALMERLEYYIGSSDIILSTENNTLEISMYNDDIDDTLIYNYDLNNVKITKDEDGDEIEEIDVEDYLDLDDLIDDDIILDKDLK